MSNSPAKKKNIYRLSREAMGYTREEASEALSWLSPEQIERIESEKMMPRPEDVLLMAKTYKNPEMCNYFCSNQCEIGKKYVPEVKLADLSQIMLKMLASLNAVQDRQKRMIEITADGKIKNSEMEDFVRIQEELENISIEVEALQLWSEHMLATGVIDRDAYQAYKKQHTAGRT